MPKILIVGGGYAGFYTAWKLEKWLRSGEAEVTVVDPLPYMTYQPFLPEVAAGSIDPRHAIVPLRQHLKKTRILAAKVTQIDHATKTATITPNEGAPFTEEYDQIVVTAGSVSRTFPIAGVADNAIGMKTIEEAVAVRDRLIGNFDRASVLPAGSAERARLLTVTVVGGGFAGIETIAELRSLATALLKDYPEITFSETAFHLVEAMGRIMPEVSLETSKWVIADLDRRGAQIHLDTQLKSADKGVVELSTGETFESDLIIWTAGVMASPMLKNTDLPLDDRFRLRGSATLQVSNDDGIVEGAWTAGDVSATPDLTGGGVGGFCVPNAQHAVRQAKVLARNLTATLRGEGLHEYVHKNLGAVAGLGLGTGVFQSGNRSIKGFPAWVAHRGYHGLAMPTWERKIRVVGGWALNVVLGRDIATIETVAAPRAAFQEFASRPKPAASAAPVAPPVAAAPAAAQAPAGDSQTTWGGAKASADVTPAEAEAEKTAATKAAPRTAAKKAAPKTTKAEAAKKDDNTLDEPVESGLPKK